MKYGFVAAILAVSLTLVGRADSYLYWMFDNYETGYQFGSARIGVVNDGETTYLTSYSASQGLAVGGGVSFLEMYTKLAAGAGTGSSFLLELLNDGGSVAYASGLVEWNNSYIASTDGIRAMTPLSFVVSPAPEPTGGLLLLFGVAALALRRRRLRGAVLTLVLLGSYGVQAAFDDTIVCFSTKGPDRYADGSQVLDGERYALVWSEDGAFDGFKADGSPVNAKDEILAVVPFARDGHCPLAAYPLPGDRLSSISCGTLAVWLLDTRVYGTDGKVSFAPANGPTNVTAVAAAVQVTSSITVSPEKRGVFADLADVKPSPTAVPADAPRPTIAVFRIVEDAKLVYLTVTNTASYLTYGVSAGATPGELKSGAARNPVTGGGTITLVTEKKDGASQFFSIGRHK